ncbi:ChaN family lipoprotein [Jannaschia rubra]|uniref:Putative iron-regulated protein n=1 Tax=Jannaschia rubra TaxID=282197 RepID=A0A0M6XU02_9RHOB|nr:ChaN family lipoprotein [Jannaschia rubra]CTQ33414.1 putative iron-regulated protein [Jannaschia rubra]SFG01262.1 Uncharacterized iron-regulated protein [Jannaschia rubra]
MRPILVWLLLTLPAGAQTLPPADVYVLGEVHDNPTHHAVQARLVAGIDPAAVVFEMLTQDQAGRIAPDTPRDADTLDALLDWSGGGWPDMAMYAPIMAASDAPILGAAGPAGELGAYGLEGPLPPEQQAGREALQQAAHCGALPDDALLRFVARQRAMDARFAAHVLRALKDHGPPVVLIAGNGHARADWGVPAAIARVRPDLRVVSVVQGEGEEMPPADVILHAPAPERGDPCVAFR